VFITEAKIDDGSNLPVYIIGVTDMTPKITNNEKIFNFMFFPRCLS